MESLGRAVNVTPFFLEMQSHSREATVTPHRRGVAASELINNVHSDKILIKPKTETCFPLW